MAIGKRKRFKIFHRDNFTCQYCGNKPPEVVLEVDHVVSRKDGGGDEEMNLITACFNCNRGKSATSVDIEKKKNKSFKKELDLLKEKKDQLQAYYDFLTEKELIEEEELDIYQECWEKCCEDQYSLSDYGLKKIKKLTQKYTAEMIFEAMKIAWNAKHVEPDQKFRYMAGVLKQLDLKKNNPEKYESNMQASKYMYWFFNCWRQQSKGSGYVSTHLKDLVKKGFDKEGEGFKQVITETIEHTYSERRSSYSKKMEDELEEYFSIREWMQNNT